MEENRDIYKTKEPESSPEPGLSFDEPTPVQVRFKVLRVVVGFITLMLLLLGISAWLIYRQEKKTVRPEAEKKAGESMVLPPQPSSLTKPTTSLLEPEIAMPSDTPDQIAPPADKKINPEKMAMAIGEVRIAKQYLSAKDLENAEIHARKALEIWPKMNAGQRMLGVVYTHRGQFDQAIGILEQAIETDPFSAETYNNLAAAYMQKGMNEKAEELLVTALQIQPNYYVSTLNLALLYLVSERFEEAVERFESSLRQLPNNPNALNNLAVALIRLGRYEEARHYLGNLVRSNPQIPIAYFNTAISYTLENKFAEAMEWIRSGSKFCSPAACRQFLADNDFDGMRGDPAFQAFVKDMFPDIGKP